MIWSVSVVRSRKLRRSDVTAIDRIGWSSGLNRVICGSFTSSRKLARMAETFSRTSCNAWTEEVFSSNSAITTDWPS